MFFVHYITKLRYVLNFRLKLNVCDEFFEYIVKKYYKIPCFRREISSKNGDKKVIISLTTIPSRLDKVWMTTESLLRQLRRPDKIILWLAEDEFKEIEMPKVLRMQQKRGLEIRYCKDIKSYKKFYYTMLENPNDYILVVDDDFIYSEKLVSEMLAVNSYYPECIVCNRAHKVRADKNGIFPYFRWIWYENRKITEENPSFHNFLTSGAGTLFPVWLLDKEIFREDVFMKIAPTADDVWLNFIAWKSNMKVVLTKGVLGYMLPIHSSSDRGLFLKNIVKKIEANECENDFQIRAVLEYLKLDVNKFI